MKWALRLLVVAVFIAVFPTARAADMSGTWKGSFDFQGSPVPVVINLRIDGSKVTGNVVNGPLEGLSPAPEEIHDGALAGDTVTFWVKVDYQGQSHKLVYKGKAAADQISFDFGTEDGSWSSPLTVKRGSEDAAAPPAVPDVTGDWKGTFDLNGTPTELKFHLKSTGNMVTGTMERAGSAPVEVHEGKIEGDTVNFWITTDYEGETYTIVYKGKISPGQIDFDFGTSDQSWGAQMVAKKS